MKDKIAIFMICLVLSLTIVTADAYAGIVSVETHGIDGISNTAEREGYRRNTNDQAIIEVVAENADGSAVTKDKLKIGTAPNFLSFTEDCVQEPLSTKYRCKFIDTRDFAPGKHSFTVRLFETTTPTQYTTAVDEKSGTLYSDGLGPLIEILEVSQVGENVSVKYNVRDKACDDADCNGKCAGIMKVVFPGADPAYEELLNTSDCSVNNIESIVHIPQTGVQAITLVAHDRVGLQTTATSELLLIDTNAPRIGDNFNIRVNERDLGYISTSAGDRIITNAVLTVEVDEENISQAFANLQELNSFSVIEDYSNVPATGCNLVNTKYVCNWTGLNLVISEEGPKISVTVIDKAGYSETKEIQKNLLVDNSAPEILFLGTDNCKMVDDEQMCFITDNNNTIFARIRESGAGFHQNFSRFGELRYKRMILDMTSLRGGGLDNLRVFADDCVQTGADEWVCIWKNVNVDSAFKAKDSFRLNVVDGSKDDAQNSVVGITSATIYIDRTLPVIEELKVVPITEAGSLEGILVGGRHVSAIAKITDELPVTGYADFSNVISGVGVVQGECAVVENFTTICLWEDAGLANSVSREEPAWDRDILFTFEDATGNTVNQTVTLDILFQEDSLPNYWSIDVDDVRASPGKLDKATMHLIPQRVYFEITPQRTGVSNVELRVLEIEGCEGKDSDLIMGGKLVRGSSKEWINLEIVPHMPEENVIELNFECTLKIISIVNDKIVTGAEIENVTLSVPLYDSGLILEEQINGKIDDAKDDLLFKLSDNGVFGTLSKVMDIFEKICKITQLYGTIVQLIATVRQVVDVMSGTPWGEAAKAKNTKLQSITNSAKQGMLKHVYKWCEFISCNKKNTENIFGSSMGSFYFKDAKKTKNFGFFGSLSKYPENPKESLALSLSTGCIPGIIYNLRKYRKINCEYISCLKKKVPAGTPISVCEYQKSYATCTFVWGNLFSIIPFAGALQKVFQQFYYALSHPLSLVTGFVMSKVLACKTKAVTDAKKGVTAYNVACTFVYLVPEIKRLTEDLKNFADKSAWTVDDSVCSILDEE
ncbi:MAG: hypothetical protein U9R08_03040 [Nanoarchaeota archaeon]|nr:hypothetical protein [Nanoarchaeota archaeon]